MGILQVSNLQKSFGQVKAVENISFEVQQGEVFTIIGPNGAGKTTTLEMIEGLQHPDTGDIMINGWRWENQAERIKEIIGVQPQSSALFELLTIYENLDVFQSFYAKTVPINEILDLVNLQEHQHKKVKVLSGGQKQRLAIGLAMVNDPEVLFLDEPTTGLDPQARRNIWDIILRLKNLGKTVILTTHYMEEAEKLSDRVCIVDQGQVIAIDTPQHLIQNLTEEREIRIVFEAIDAGSLVETVQNYPSVTKVVAEERQLCFWSLRPEESLYHLFRHTAEQHLAVEQMTIKDLSLEDVFIKFTGKEWRD